VAAALLVSGAAVLALANSPLRFAFAAPLLLTALLCGLAARPSPIGVTTDDRWARALPDLDARDTAREESELLASQALGATPALREAAMRSARSVARLLNWTSIAAGSWALAAPSSPWAVGAAFLYPAMALVVALSGHGAYRLFKTRNDPRPALSMAIVFPVLLASIRVFEYQLVTPRALLVPALACGAALTALAVAGRAPTPGRPRSGGESSLARALDAP
jgi:hypothetical protein